MLNISRSPYRLGLFYASIALAASSCFTGELMVEGQESGSSSGGSSGGSGPSEHMIITGPTTLQAGECAAYTITAADASEAPIPLNPSASDMVVYAGANYGSTYLSTYSDSYCQSPSSGHTVSASAASQVVYFRSPVPGTVALYSHSHPSYSGSNLLSISVSTDSPFTSVATVAGPPAPRGYVEKTAPGGVSRFNEPMAVACTASAVYVADIDNKLIRRIDPSTGYTSIVGGVQGNYGVRDSSPGFAGSFDRITSMVEADGALYFVESWAHVVRSLDLTTGVLTTIAGAAYESGSVDGTGTSARFNNPRYIATDGAYLYISDQMNTAIRKVDLFDNSVTTLVGTPMQPGPIAVVGGMVYVHLGTLGGHIHKYDAFSGSDLGSSVASLGYNVTAMTADTVATRLIFTSGSTVKFASPGGGASNLAGSGPGMADGDGLTARFQAGSEGLCFDGSNYAYLADTRNHAIRRIDRTGGATTTVGGPLDGFGMVDGTLTTARFNGASAITKIGSDLYVLDKGNARIRLVSGGSVSTLIDFSGLAPYAITSDASHLYVLDSAGNLKKYLPDGTYVNQGAACVNGTITSDGTYVYVACSTLHTVRQYQVDTTIGAIATYGASAQTGATDGIGASARFNRPSSIAYAAGYVYVVDEGTSRIRRINPTSQAVTTVTLIPELSSFQLAIAADANHLYLTSPSAGALLRFTYADQKVIRVLGYERRQEDIDGAVATGATAESNSLYVDASGIYFTNGWNVRLLSP